MSNLIKVTPQELLSAANTLDNVNADFNTQVNNLKQAVENLNAKWQGADNEAFKNQIGQFENDFVQMSKIIVEYSKFLKDANQNYTRTQQEAVAAAQKLATHIK